MGQTNGTCKDQLTRPEDYHVYAIVTQDRSQSGPTIVLDEKSSSISDDLKSSLRIARHRNTLKKGTTVGDKRILNVLRSKIVNGGIEDCVVVVVMMHGFWGDVTFAVLCKTSYPTVENIISNLYIDPEDTPPLENKYPVTADIGGPLVDAPNIERQSEWAKMTWRDKFKEVDKSNAETQRQYRMQHETYGDSDHGRDDLW